MLLFVIPSAYSIDNSKVRYYSVIEVTETSLNLALSSLENQDFDSTKNFIEFGSTHFSKNLEKSHNPFRQNFRFNQFYNLKYHFPD